MNDVRVMAASCSHAGLEHEASMLQRRFSYAPARNPMGAARVLLTERRLPEPFRVYPDRGVVVSTWESAGVCRYTDLALDRYLQLTTLIALAQWRALRNNRLLQLEDLLHPDDGRCVFSGACTVQEFALLLDPPSICRGCTNFYHCLGVDSELIALKQIVDEITRAKPAALTPSLS